MQYVLLDGFLASFAFRLCKIQFRPGLRPGPRWGSLQRSPYPLVAKTSPVATACGERLYPRFSVCLSVSNLATLASTATIRRKDVQKAPSVDAEGVDSETLKAWRGLKWGGVAPLSLSDLISVF